MRGVLHCHAFGQDDEWQAICLDLDLAVQGRSFEEVFRLLGETISFHIEGIMELPEADRQRLLNRRVPWIVRLKFAVAAFLLGLRSQSNGPFEHRYTIPSPA
jgi:predicted RNase H-like HicB family nuclease